MAVPFASGIFYTPTIKVHIIMFFFFIFHIVDVDIYHNNYYTAAIWNIKNHEMMTVYACHDSLQSQVNVMYIAPACTKTKRACCF